MTWEELQTGIGTRQPEFDSFRGKWAIFCVGKVTRSGSRRQLEVYSVELMRIKALNMLDRRRWNRRDEFHEISVPCGLAPAEGMHKQAAQCNVLYVVRYTRGSTFHPPCVRPLRVDSNMIKAWKILKR
jgi:hypothetical protein